MATRLNNTDLCQNYETVEGLSMPGPFLSYIVMKIVACGKHGPFVVGLNIFISFLQLNKHINTYVNNTSYGIRTEAKSL